MTDDKLPVGHDRMPDREAPKRCGGRSRGAGFEPRRTLRFVICHLSFVILFTACATRPTFRTVVVDPGHGEHDPGATQRGVSPEKTWTLDLAYRLKTRLEAGGFHVV